MAEIPILAYYYNQEEEQIILQYLKPEDKTSSFIYGLINTNDLARLKRQGILVDVVETESKDLHGLKRGLLPESGSRFLHYEQDTSGIGPIRVEDIYVIQIKGPLLPSWQKVLDESNIEILESLQSGVYKISTKKDIAYLQNLDFVLSVKPFESTDTEVIVRRSVLADMSMFDPVQEKIAIYDIRVDERQTQTVINFFDQKSIPVLASSSGKVRVKLEGTFIITELRKIPGVQAIEEFIKPVLHNDKARISLNIDAEDHGTLNHSIPFEGAGEIVGVADTGIDSRHPDLQAQIYKTVARGRPGDASDPNGHGTHVSGSIVGNGNASRGLIRGLAPKAKLFFQSVMDADGALGGLPLDLRDLFQEAYDAGVRIHNNSWGALADSEYLFNSLEVDQFVYDHKDMLIVISAGNEGSAFQPRNSKSGFVDWLSLGSPATAKNALSVGASRSIRTSGGFAPLTYGQAWPDVYPDDPMWSEKISGDAESLAGFSSRGPCGNESRIKPDVVAPGTDIASTKSADAPIANFWGPYPKNRSYAFMGGTSMASPIVAGFAVLIREYFVKTFSHSPSAALLKACIVNGTRVLRGSDALADHAFVPNFHQGFGCVDMKNTIPNALQKDLKMVFIDSWQQPDMQLKYTGQRLLFRIQVSDGLPLRLCLTWTDPPGRGLQNNLNLFLMHVDQQKKWTGNAEIPRTITVFDRDNNVEIIRLENAPAGEYLIAVQAANIIFGPQDFALVVTGKLDSDSLTLV